MFVTEIIDQFSAGDMSFWTYVLVYLGGAATSLAPCVYPMIPISAGVVGGLKPKSTLDAFRLAMIYAFGLAIIYGALGLFAASTGQLFGTVSAHPATSFIMANILLLFGAFLMGWINMPHMSIFNGQLPRFRWKAATSFGYGAVSGLVMAPCTAPVLGVLLLYVGKSGDLVNGAGLLFVFAFGLNSLLIVSGTFGGLRSFLPKTGNWNRIVMVAMALLMLGGGEYFLLETGKRLF